MTTQTFKPLNRGPFPDSRPEQMPGWYLTHLVGSVGEVKWESLDTDQQKAIQDEIKKRERAAPAPAEASPGGGVGGTPAAATPATTATPAAPAAATEPTVSAEELHLTGKGARKAKTAAEGTVEEAKEIIASADAEELDNIVKAEAAGKNRVSVHAAIDKRREELAANANPTT